MDGLTPVGGLTPVDHRRAGRPDVPVPRRAPVSAALRTAVQDHRRLVREGVAALLAAEPAVHSVTCVAALDELSDAVARGELDLVVFSAAQDPPSSWSGGSLRLQRFTDATSASGLVAAVDGHPDPGGLAPGPPEPTPWGAGLLTRRETQILRRIADGMSSLEAATSLGISARTVENHKQRIFAKLGVQSQAHAVAVALTTRQLPVTDLDRCTG